MHEAFFGAYASAVRLKICKGRFFVEIAEAFEKLHFGVIKWGCFLTVNKEYPDG